MGTIVIITASVSLFLVWIGYQLKNAPFEEELWPDLKREVKI
jgi:hypothetical protein